MAKSYATWSADGHDVFVAGRHDFMGSECFPLTEELLTHPNGRTEQGEQIQTCSKPKVQKRSDR